MRPLLVFVGLALLLAGPAAAADWRLGLQGGLNNSGLKGDAPSGVSFGKKSGLAAGAVVEMSLAEDVWLSVQPMYLQRGTTSRIAVSGQEEELEGPTVDLTYLAVPILARIVANSGHTYVTGGFNPAFLLDSTLTDAGVTEDIGSLVRGFDLAADIGFGVLIPIGRPVINLELRYEQSILNLASNEPREDEEVLPVRFRSSGFQFLAGLTWTLGGGDRNE